MLQSIQADIDNQEEIDPFDTEKIPLDWWSKYGLDKKNRYDE